MRERVQKRRSSRKRTTRWIVAAVILCSAMSCVAPVLYASDCSRWVAEYKQGILQRRAARRLLAAKYRLTALVHPARPIHHHPSRRPMGPLEALRRFQIDCGDLGEGSPRLPLTPLVAPPLAVAFPLEPVPDLPLPTPAEVAENVPVAVPPLAEVPTTSIPSENVPSASPVPEPGSALLVLSGFIGFALVTRRQERNTA